MKVDFANLNYQYGLYKEEIDSAIQEVLDSSKYIMGPQIGHLEEKLTAFIGGKHCIACSSGTDALQLALLGLGIGPGDEVITTPFTFIATAEMIAHVGAKPVFVDIDEKTYNIDPELIEPAVTAKTKAIMPVGLFGQPADMDEINALADSHHLPVIEDAAQSFGAGYKDGMSCNLSQIGCTSFFPAKPLGCYGDGGAVFTCNDQLAEKIRAMRVHGQNQRYRHKYRGIGARMDTVQAAVLLAKLRHYPHEIQKRQDVAAAYTDALKGKVMTPHVKEDRTSVWAQYSIRLDNRDGVREKLQENGIPTAVHYPMPLHLQECFQHLGGAEGDFPIAERVGNEIMSLPMNPFLDEEDIRLVAGNLLALI